MTYFDNAATHPPLPEVLSDLDALNRTVFGNPSSRHAEGRRAAEVLDAARVVVAKALEVPDSHVIFTSGGTESNNLALWGALGGIPAVLEWLKTSDSRSETSILATTVEHDATKKHVEALAKMGAPVGWLKVNREGMLDLAQLDSACDSRVRLLSMHHVQNETGAQQDLAAIVALVRRKQPGAWIHVDALQSFLRSPLSLAELEIDSVSIGAHKIGGPKGVGALVLGHRLKDRSTKIGNLLYGSTQQFGVRPGTVPVPLIGGFATAVSVGLRNFEKNRNHLLDLREALISRLPQDAIIHGPRDLSRHATGRAPHIINFSIPGMPSTAALEALSELGFCVSSGAACKSSGVEPSATLMQMGVPRELATCALRVSFSHGNKIEEVESFAKALLEVRRNLA